MPPAALQQSGAADEPAERAAVLAPESFAELSLAVDSADKPSMLCIY